MISWQNRVHFICCQLADKQNEPDSIPCRHSSRASHVQRRSTCGNSWQMSTNSTSPVGIATDTHTYTHPFNGPFSRTTWVSWYQKGKTNLDFTEARDSEWQWHQLGRMHVCISLQTDNHASTPPLSFLQAGCPSCRPTNSVKALKG